LFCGCSVLLYLTTHLSCYQYTNSTAEIFMQFMCFTFQFVILYFYYDSTEGCGYCSDSDTQLLRYMCFILTFMCFRYEDASRSSFDYPSHDQGIQSGSAGVIGSVLHLVKLLFNLSMIKYPSLLSSSITKWSIVLFSELHFVTFCLMKLTFIIQEQGIPTPGVPAVIPTVPSCHFRLSELLFFHE
jgi:hypothetical protein